jgi:hypothetical protein
MEMLQGLLITGIKIYQVSTEVFRACIIILLYSFYLVFSKNNSVCINIDFLLLKRTIS